MVSSFKHWIKSLEHPASIGLIAILIVAAFLRLYRLEETVVFQADQGRDAIIVKELVKEFDVKLIGPVTSVGNMYLGPFYYYFMAPFLWLSYPSPIGPVIAVAVLNVFAVYLIYQLGTKIFDKQIGLIAALLFAIMQPAVVYSRFSWNPNLMAAIALVLVGSVHTAWHKRKPSWLIVAWLSFAILIQLHYVALVMGAWLGLISLYWLWQRPTDKLILIKNNLIGISLFIASFAPIVIFDFSHDHLISRGFGGFFTSNEHHIRSPFELTKIITQIEGRALHTFAQLWQVPEDPWQLGERMLVYGVVGFIIYLWHKGKLKSYQTFDLLLLGSWIAVTIIGTSFYTSSVFDHYVIFVYPATSLLYGLVLKQLWLLKPIGSIAGIFLALFLIYANLNLTPAFQLGGPPLSQFSRTVSTVLPYIQNYKYNVLLISDNLDHKGLNYRYFFDVSSHPPAGIDDFDNLDRLVLIDDKLSQKPFDHGIYELEKVNYRNIESQFRVPNGPIVYILKP